MHIEHRQKDADPLRFAGERREIEILDHADIAHHAVGGTDQQRRISRNLPGGIAEKGGEPGKQDHGNHRDDPAGRRESSAANFVSVIMIAVLSLSVMLNISI